MCGPSKAICSSLFLLIPLQTILCKGINGLRAPGGFTVSALGHLQKQKGSTIPHPSTYVSDLAEVIQETTRASLESTLTNLERQAGIELKLVTVETTGAEDIFGFSHRVARDWNIGHRTNPRKSLLMVIAVKERSVFVQFSRAAQLGLPEGIIGETRQRILESIDSPQFNEGLINGVGHLISSLTQRIGLSASATGQAPSTLKFDRLSAPTSRKDSAQPGAKPTIPEISPARRGDMNAAKVSHGLAKNSERMITDESVETVIPTRSTSNEIPLLQVAASFDSKLTAALPEGTGRNTSPANPPVKEPKFEPEVISAKEDLLNSNPEKNPRDSRFEVYRVGIRDVLTIATADAANQFTLYTVDEDGSIDFAGVRVVVAGLTTAQILERLKTESKTQGLETRNLLAVSVRQYASHAITVTGLLRIQGTLYLKRETVRLYAIIAEVQPQFGAGEVIVMRGGKAGPALDLYDPEALRYVIEPGDVINVTARRQQFYYIGGRIQRPGQKGFEPGVTLLQAILAAGGLIRQSDKIQLLREGSDSLLSTSKFDLREIKSGRIEDVRLQPGDRLEIGP